MRHTNLALALLTAAVLTACGGNGSKPGDQTLKTKYSAQVTFGDSLSDVGTYAVGAIAQLGGGKWTINGDNTAKSPVLTGKNWTELVAAQLGLPAPCAAQTGLVGTATGFAVPVTSHAGCTNYAQGGARVTVPYGPGNPAVTSGGFAMTVPVVQQVANFLAASGGKFSGTELVTVMAGGNDILTQLGQLSAAATAAGTTAGQTAFATSLTMQLAAGATNPQTAAQAIGLAIQTESARAGHTDTSVVTAAVTAAVMAGNTAAGSPAVYGPMVAKAQADASTAGAKAGADYFAANAPSVVAGMATAGTELANLVKTQIIGKGANYVIVNNLPDVASSPSGTAQTADVRALIDTAVKAFNTALSTGVGGDSKVLYVDLYATSHDQVANPTPYGLTNTKDKACGTNALGGSSLVCNGTNVVAGDVSHYMFADDVHPTPYEYSLVARYVLEQMVVKGWL
ncbi:MAG: SGNH/GDSL hydrolase family protein [Telluria sp.]